MVLRSYVTRVNPRAPASRSNASSDNPRSRPFSHSVSAKTWMSFDPRLRPTATSAEIC